jgi:prepilin-type N-terminal cleavage/methylation domain-containing protein
MNIESIRLHSGYTLAELMVAITVSGVVIVGIILFMNRLQGDIISSADRTRTVLALSDLSERVRSARAEYSVLKQVQSGTGAFDAIIFTNTGSTSGYIFTTVNLSDPTPNGNYPFEGSGALTLHKERPLVFKTITQSDIIALTLSGASLTTLPPASSKEIFEKIQLADFRTALFNSGAIGEVRIRAFTTSYPELAGRPRSQVPLEGTLDYTLNF